MKSTIQQPTYKQNKSFRMIQLYKITLLSFLLSIPLSNIATAQETVTDTAKKYTQPSWWFGAAVGANFNFYEGSTHQLTTDFAPPVTFHNGFGVGLY
jgi:hypothetical protein